MKTQNNSSYILPDKTVEVSHGLHINFTETGKGKTLLFIHGLANFAQVWQLQQNKLSSFRCIAIDLPGCGHSSKGYLPYSMVYYSEVIALFIKKMQLTDVTICGHSMGGQVALIFALRYPQLAQKLILIAPSGFEQFTAFEIAAIKQMLPLSNWFISDETKLVQSLKQSFFKLNATGSQIINDLQGLLSQTDLAQWRYMVNRCIVGMLTEPVYDLLPFLASKTLVIFGCNDALIPNTMLHYSTTQKIAQRACKQIPDAQLHMIEHAGHAVFLEKPDEVNRLIIDFMNVSD
ncbi:MAG: alpha/beta hydrolase [Bacteroidia bacterium]|nr:alpha/beta hydrolase [Bacteroidia bacterium]